MKQMKGKNAVITGSAGGIGRATAVEFAREGMNVVIADLNDAGMEETAELVREQGVSAAVRKTDVSDKSAVKALVDFTVSEMGSVDLLMNNAGIAVIGEMRDLSLEEDWEKVMGVNLWGPIYGCHFVLPHMIERGSGHIVTMSSGAGLFTSPCMAPYCTTKFGLVGMSEVLRNEVARLGIGVTCVCPAFVKTTIFETTPMKNITGLDTGKINRYWGQTPGKIARQIVQGVKGNKGLLILTPEAKAMYYLKRFLPFLYNAIGFYTAGKLGKMRRDSDPLYTRPDVRTCRNSGDD